MYERSHPTVLLWSIPPFTPKYRRTSENQKSQSHRPALVNSSEVMKSQLTGMFKLITVAIPPSCSGQFLLSREISQLVSVVYTPFCRYPFMRPLLEGFLRSAPMVFFARKLCGIYHLCLPPLPPCQTGVLPLACFSPGMSFS